MSFGIEADGAGSASRCGSSYTKMMRPLAVLVLQHCCKVGMRRISGWPNIWPDNPDLITCIRPDTGFDGRMFSRIPDLMARCPAGYRYLK
jgi:hypothetical protein